MGEKMRIYFIEKYKKLMEDTNNLKETRIEIDKLYSEQLENLIYFKA
jgi:hypothetical protein